jgi:ABC-type microcin C transport system duplicated ATPase subunit YejF
MDVAKASDGLMRTIRGNEIGMIFQEPMTSLNPVFTVGRQLTEHLRVHKGMTKAEAEARALELLRQVRIPEPERRLGQYPHELSGGMRQRVVIAIALACEPRLLIADEPTTALDVTIQAEILALIDRLKRETGTAVMFITHDMSVVAQMADRVVVMYRGRKVEEGPVTEIFENPQHDYTKALLAAVPKLGEMTGKDAPEPMRLLGSVPKVEGPIEIREMRVLLDVKNLTTRFPVKGGFFRRTVANVHAVEDVSFGIMSGETLSLVGESGCGKSTCGRSLLRLVEPLSGEVRLDGKDVIGFGTEELRQARRDMQMVFQDPFASLNPQMQLADQVAEPLRNYNLAAGDELMDRVAQLFDRVELPRSFMRRYPHELVGRAAAADRHRPGAGAEAQAHRGGRGGLGAGRERAGAGAEPDDGTAGGSRDLDPLHQPRHGGGGAGVAPCGRDVSGPDRGAGHAAADLRGPAPSLHAVAPEGGADRGPAAAEVRAGPELQADPLADLPGGACRGPLRLRRGDAGPSGPAGRLGRVRAMTRPRSEERCAST